MYVTDLNILKHTERHEIRETWIDSSWRVSMAIILSLIKYLDSYVKIYISISGHLPRETPGPLTRSTSSLNFSTGIEFAQFLPLYSRPGVLPGMHRALSDTS